MSSTTDRIVDWIDSHGDPITLYRGLFLKSPSDFRVADVGVSWTPEKSRAFSPFGYLDRVAGSEYVVTARVRKSDIDVPGTVATMRRYPDEREIRIKKDAVVEIVSVSPASRRNPKRPSPPLATAYADKVLAEAVASTRGMTLKSRATVLGRYSLRIYKNHPSFSADRTGIAWLLFSGKELVGTGRLLVENGVFARAGIAVIAPEYRRQGLYAAVLPILRKKLGVPIESDVSMTAGAIGAWKRAGGKLTDRQGDKVFRINPSDTANVKAMKLWIKRHRVPFSSAIEIDSRVRAGERVADAVTDILARRFSEKIRESMTPEEIQLIASEGRPKLSSLQMRLSGMKTGWSAAWSEATIKSIRLLDRTMEDFGFQTGPRGLQVGDDPRYRAQRKAIWKLARANHFWIPRENPRSLVDSWWARR